MWAKYNDEYKIVTVGAQKSNSENQTPSKLGTFKSSVFKLFRFQMFGQSA